MPLDLGDPGWLRVVEAVRRQIPQRGGEGCTTTSGGDSYRYVLCKLLSDRQEQTDGILLSAAAHPPFICIFSLCSENRFVRKLTKITYQTTAFKMKYGGVAALLLFATVIESTALRSPASLSLRKQIGLCCRFRGLVEVLCLYPQRAPRS